MTSRRGLALCALGALVATGLSCSPPYVAQAAYEEARILWRRQPIDSLLGNASLPKDRRDKLQLVLDARKFAAEALGLRVAGSYRSISEIDGGAVVQVVTAARRDKLKNYTWWFPVVGRVPYKGFFSRSAALALASSLEKQGYDTYVRSAIAFSTLGWFDDPLPSTLLERSRTTLANVIFHELLHNTLFVPGEIAFNESAATFVGDRGAIEFFCRGDRPNPEACKAAQDDWRDMLTMSAFLTASIGELEDFYDTRPSGAALDRGRRRLFAEIRERFDGLPLVTKKYVDFGNGPLNNATLLHDRLYLKDLDLFEELYRTRGSVREAVNGLREAARAGNPFTGLRNLLRVRGTEQVQSETPSNAAG